MRRLLFAKSLTVAIAYKFEEIRAKKILF